MKSRLVGVALLTVSIAYVVAARGFEAGFIADPIGPNAFPYGIGALLVLGCGALLFESRSGELPSLSWRHGALCVVLVTYIFALNFLGFVLATTILASVIARLSGGPTKRTIVMSFLLSVSIFVLFVYGLSIPLPRGF